MAVLHRSTSFLPFFGRSASFFTPFFMILPRNGKKTGAQKWRNGKGKNAFLSRFFPVPVFSRSLPGTSLPLTQQQVLVCTCDTPITPVTNNNEQNSDGSVTVPPFQHNVVALHLTPLGTR